MIVDSSALVAILVQEPEAEVFTDLLGRAPRPLLSAGTWIELSSVICRQFQAKSFDRLDDLMTAFGIEIVPVTIVQAQIGRAAYRRYGRGNDPRAKLNFGDCFAYALAMETDQPLLFKGDDFVHTDVKPAVPR